MNKQTEEFQIYFSGLVAQKQLSHGYLFTGEDLLGKRAVVKSIGQALACPNLATDDRACGRCEVCERIKADQYPDILTIEPIGQSVRVDQIRELKDWLAKSPVEGLFKMVMIEAADSMNPSAANALLTFLEEPVANVYLFLFAKEAELLLPTIRSRVQQNHFQPDDQAFIIEQLTEVGVLPSHAQVMARFSSETIERLSQSYEEADMTDWFAALNQLFGLLATSNRGAFVTIQSRLKAYLTVQQALDGLDYLLLLNHSTIKQLSSGRPVQAVQTEKDTTDTSTKAAGEIGLRIQQKFVDNLLEQYPISLHHLLKMNQTFYEVKQRIGANVSPQLAYERLAIKLCQWT